jgi:uncharacterized RDD family membrane protein YckC
MKSRFEPDTEAGAQGSARLVDPEAYDASEQQFAASLEDTPAPQRPRFVVEEAGSTAESAALRIQSVDAERHPGEQHSPEADIAGSSKRNEAQQLEKSAFADGTIQETTTPTTPQLDVLQVDPTEWRQEVAARLNKYRARRRPREPRYPSLRLKFEAIEPERSDSELTHSASSALPTRQSVALENAGTASTALDFRLAEPTAYAQAVPTAASEATAKIIEFPGSLAAPPRPLDELAEPVLERPRILEVPELAPPPPALGGILIEPMERPANERRPGFELPLQPAAMWRRVLATGIDALLVLSSFALFAYVFFKITAISPPLQQALEMSVILAGILWAAYQYLLLVYAGTTPGLRLVKLELSRFDGTPVPRRIRRWRVLASVLSGVPLGLGYAWCFFDEDELCWHDRITRTYMAPKK